MLTLNFRKRDNYGNIILTDDGIVRLLYSGEINISELIAEESSDIKLYNKWAQIYDDCKITTYKKPSVTISEFDKKLQSEWFIPDEYKLIDVTTFLLNKCQTDDEINRVKMELTLFKEREMIIILQVLIYLVDLMRENNIVWGVGRGSSCASYCLFLIGIHKVNSLKFNLDIKEFLK